MEVTVSVRDLQYWTLPNNATLLLELEVMSVRKFICDYFKRDLPIVKSILRIGASTTIKICFTCYSKI